MYTQRTEQLLLIVVCFQILEDGSVNGYRMMLQEQFNLKTYYQLITHKRRIIIIIHRSVSGTPLACLVSAETKCRIFWLNFVMNRPRKKRNTELFSIEQQMGGLKKKNKHWVHGPFFCLLFQRHQTENEPGPENSFHLAPFHILKYCIIVH